MTPFVHRKLFFTRQTPAGPINESQLDCATDLILLAAERRGIKWSLIEGTRIIRLEKDGRVTYFRNRTPSATHSPSAKIVADKGTTKFMLQAAGVSSAHGFSVYQQDSVDQIKTCWDALQKPLVIKETHGTHGDNVFVGIESWDETQSIIQRIFAEKSLPESYILLEEMFVGKEYRVIATRDKVLAITERLPAFLVGNGRDSVQQLLATENENPLRNVAEDLYPQLKLDDDVLRNLHEQQLAPESIPQDGQHFLLRKVSNVSAGGVSIDRTDEVHPSVKEIALKTVRAIPGLAWAGIDFMTHDITALQTADSYVIIEINAAPELDMQEVPMIGSPRNVCDTFLDLCFQMSQPT